jgi:hypothetical protein
MASGAMIYIHIFQNDWFSQDPQTHTQHGEHISLLTVYRIYAPLGFIADQYGCKSELLYNFTWKSHI